MGLFDFFKKNKNKKQEKYKLGMHKTRENSFGTIKKILEARSTIDDELFDVYSYITELFPDAVITEPSGEKGRLVSSINLNDKTIVDTYTLEKSNGEKYSLDVFNDGSCVLLEIKPTPNLRGFSITNSGSSYTIKWTYFSVTLYSTAYLFLNRLCCLMKLLSRMITQLITQKKK